MDKLSRWQTDDICYYFYKKIGSDTSFIDALSSDPFDTRMGMHILFVWFYHYYRNRIDLL